MSLFENYKFYLDDDDRQTTLRDLLIRPAKVSDSQELGIIQAEREGGVSAIHAVKIEQAINSWTKTSQGIILVAKYDNKLVGLAKIKYFSPAPASPSNAAPAGWYLSGVIVRSKYRRCGVGQALTQARLEWITARASCAYYFANAQNQVSIALHNKFGFKELTRDFTHPGVTFTGGVGILFGADLTQGKSA